MALVTVAEVQTYLGTNGTGAPVPNANDTAALQQLIDAAAPVIAREARSIEQTPYVERHDGGDADVVLFHAPVFEVTYVKEYQPTGSLTVLVESTPANPVDGYQLEAETGTILRVLQGGFPRAFWWGQRNIEISYTAGQQVTPGNAKLATLELIAEWWRMRRGGSKSFMPPGVTGEGNAATFPSGGLPPRIRRILAGDKREPDLG